jgi:hypothetical protein
MPSFISKLLAIIPALILIIFFDVLIASSVSTLVLIEMMAAGYKHFSLYVAILTATAVYLWLRFSHKLRAYVKTQETLDE